MIFYNNKISSTERTLEDIDNKVISTLSTSTLKDVNIVSDAVKTIMIPVNGVNKEVIQIFDSQNRVIWQKNPDLFPSTYQQVEYIQAAHANGAYIDLGIQYSGGCTFEIGWVYLQNDLQLFGATSDTGKKRCLLSAHISQGFSYYITVSNQVVNLAYPPNDTIIGKILRHKGVYKIGAGQTYIEDLDTGERITYQHSIDDYTVTNNLFLLGQNYNGAYRGNAEKRITYFKYWDKDDNLLRDMVPCYRRSDNVIGMFDKVSTTFFTNAGTGTFTKGNNV